MSDLPNVYERKRPPREPAMLRRTQTRTCQKHSGLGEQEKQQHLFPHLLGAPCPPGPHPKPLELKALVRLILVHRDSCQGLSLENGAGVSVWTSVLRSSSASSSLTTESCIFRESSRFQLSLIWTPRSSHLVQEAWTLEQFLSDSPARPSQSSKTSVSKVSCLFFVLCKAFLLTG